LSSVGTAFTVAGGDACAGSVPHKYLVSHTESQFARNARTAWGGDRCTVFREAAYRLPGAKCHLER
jgi:hypothetical protein